jgi:hypothetical protein
MSYLTVCPKCIIENDKTKIDCLTIAGEGFVSCRYHGNMAIKEVIESLQILEKSNEKPSDLSEYFSSKD